MFLYQSDDDPGDQILLKNQSAQNRFKMDMCIGLVITNPTQLEQGSNKRRMSKISRSVHFSKHAKFC
jgi:hypothetical protein